LVAPSLLSWATMSWGLLFFEAMVSSSSESHVLAPLRQRAGGTCVLRPASRAATEAGHRCLINRFFFVPLPWRPRMLACARRHHPRTASRTEAFHGTPPA
jgi:hypothetical protein